MSETVKTPFFKAGATGRDKAETTTSVARAIADAEAAARVAKTARLRKLREAKEAAEQAAGADVATKEKPAKGKRRA